MKIKLGRGVQKFLDRADIDKAWVMIDKKRRSKNREDFIRACAIVKGELDETNGECYCNITDHAGVCLHDNDKYVTFSWVDSPPHPNGHFDMTDIRKIDGIEMGEGQANILQVRSNTNVCSIDDTGLIEGEFSDTTGFGRRYNYRK